MAEPLKQRAVRQEIQEGEGFEPQAEGRLFAQPTIQLFTIHPKGLGLGLRINKPMNKPNDGIAPFLFEGRKYRGMASPEIFWEKSFDQKLSGNEVYYTA